MVFRGTVEEAWGYYWLISPWMSPPIETEILPTPLPVAEKIAIALSSIFFVYLIVASKMGKIPMELTEVWATITGAAGVYLTVKNNIWNFPIGLVNNIFFGILFFKSRLINDTGLQIIYFALGVWGWWVWAGGAAHKEEAPIGRANWKQLLGCCLFILFGTYFMMRIAAHWGGATPFWDALTTALCLAAQYLLGRKWIENWAFWALADIIYVPLYAYKGLYLTSALYFGFLCLCVMGYVTWLKQWKSQGVPRKDELGGPDLLYPPIAAP